MLTCSDAVDKLYNVYDEVYNKSMISQSLSTTLGEVYDIYVDIVHFACDKIEPMEFDFKTSSQSYSDHQILLSFYRQV